MVTKTLSFVQIAVSTDHIFGLTAEGDVYYRDKLPYNYSNNHVNQNMSTTTGNEERKIWKKLLMEGRVDVPRGGHEREAKVQPLEDPSAPVEVEIPARKIYKDSETVKRVQQALMDKGCYKPTNKIDGELGKYTVEGIKAFQRSINTIETGEIDLALCCALGLDISPNETIVESDNTTSTAEQQQQLRNYVDYPETLIEEDDGEYMMWRDEQNPLRFSGIGDM